MGPTQVQALQFEWAWQHPDKSKALREAYAATRKVDLKGARGKVHCFGEKGSNSCRLHLPYRHCASIG